MAAAMDLGALCRTVGMGEGEEEDLSTQQRRQQQQRGGAAAAQKGRKRAAAGGVVGRAQRGKKRVRTSTPANAETVVALGALIEGKDVAAANEAAAAATAASVAPPETEQQRQQRLRQQHRQHLEQQPLRPPGRGYGAEHTSAASGASVSSAAAGTEAVAGNAPKSAPAAPAPPPGLRHFSLRVCRKVESKGVTTYKEVADELVEDLRKERVAEEMARRARASVGSTAGAAASSSTSASASSAPASAATAAAAAQVAARAASSSQPKELSDDKNIRRRVYDALNVLTAMDIISKIRKEIRWKGLPSNAKNELARLGREKTALERRIQRKREHLEELILQEVCCTNLQRRNTAAELEQSRARARRQALTRKRLSAMEQEEATSASSGRQQQQQGQQHLQGGVGDEEEESEEVGDVGFDDDGDAAASDCNPVSSEDTGSTQMSSDAINGETDSNDNNGAEAAEGEQDEAEGKEKKDENEEDDWSDSDWQTSHVMRQQEKTRVHLPFVVLNTAPDTRVRCEVSHDQKDVVLDFSQGFELLDSNEVMKKLQLHRSTPEELKSFLDPHLMQYVPREVYKAAEAPNAPARAAPGSSAASSSAAAASASSLLAKPTPIVQRARP